MKYWKIITVVLIFILASFLRLYLLNDNPPGLNLDESSIGVDAFSLLKTGADQYGKTFPVFFRSFAVYQSPLYIYLTVIPIFFFGVSIFSVKLVSAISGILLVVTTFFILLLTVEKRRFLYASIGALVVAISPWSIFFSRSAVEANLALTFLALGLLFFILSFKNGVFLILSSLFFVISTYAYHAERVVSTLLIFVLLAIFRKFFLKKKLVVLVSLVFYFLVLFPQLLLTLTPGSTKRLNQVNYWSDAYFKQNNSDPGFISRTTSVGYEFLSHYLAYFSPRNLFFDPDPQNTRSLPDLSVFYLWMLVPFWFGIRKVIFGRNTFLNKILLTSILIFPIPAALTKEPFYTLRVLPLLWIFTIIIALGSCEILLKIKSYPLKILLVLAVTLLSIFTFYVHSFIFFKYERADYYGFANGKLVEEVNKYPGVHFVIDSGIDTLYTWFIFFNKTDPAILQPQRDFDLKDYYSSVDFNKKRSLGDIEFKPIDWGEVEIKEEVIVGNPLAVSEKQIAEHKLEKLFEIKDLLGVIMLTGYKSHLLSESKK